MATFTRRDIISTVNLTYDQALTYQASQGITLSETIVQNATTDLVFALDVSAVKGFMIVCDRACTVTTNSGGTADTITLVANKPYVWDQDDYNSFLLTHDVVSLHVALAAGVNATLKIEAVVDATP